MADDESYEIMPYKEIVMLKKEIENIKKKAGDTSSTELINSMAKLTKSMDSMLQLFRTAAEEMKAEKSSEEKFADRLEPLVDKLAEVINQNKIIAEGMVAIADIVKGQNEPKQLFKPKPAGPPQGFNYNLPPIADPADMPGAPMPPPRGRVQEFQGRQSMGMPPMGGLPPLEPPTDAFSMGNMPPLEEKSRRKGLFSFGK
ncbi:MAG: hypothetical protein ABIC04_01965 [Nanoarchaeota archaeon]